MADVFDPYHQWLGIAPGEQPPHHYRLLGIPLFEENPAVIANAADQRMGHLRTFQIGSHAALSQKLLNEVATARVPSLCGLQRRHAQVTRGFIPRGRHRQTWRIDFPHAPTPSHVRTLAPATIA